jgi:ABC-type transporter Mla subunit MlaD
VQQSETLVGQMTDAEKGLVATLAKLGQLLEQLNDPARGVGATLGKTGQLLDTLDGTVKDVTQAPLYRFFVPKREPPKP